MLAPMKQAGGDADGARFARRRARSEAYAGRQRGAGAPRRCGRGRRRLAQSHVDHAGRCAAARALPPHGGALGHWSTAEAVVRGRLVGFRTTSRGVVRRRHAAGGRSPNSPAGLASTDGRRGFGRFRRGGARMEVAADGAAGAPGEPARFSGQDGLVTTGVGLNPLALRLRPQNHKLNIRGSEHH